jgi:hypothetical protein
MLGGSHLDPWFSNWFSQWEWIGITFGDKQLENWTDSFHSRSENQVIENWLFCLNFFLESFGSMREPKSISQSTRVNCPSVNIYFIIEYFLVFFSSLIKLNDFCVIRCTIWSVANAFDMSKIKEQGIKHKKRMNDSLLQKNC